MSETSDAPNQIPASQAFETLANRRATRASAWNVFAQQVEAKIRANRLHRQPQAEIDALLASGETLMSGDLRFSNDLAITEVASSQDAFSEGWDIVYGWLAASAGDFSPYDPPGDCLYYSTREQALIAAVCWFNDKMQVAYEVLMGNEPSEDEAINVTCPNCRLLFEVDFDGGVTEVYPGDRSD